MGRTIMVITPILSRVIQELDHIQLRLVTKAIRPIPFKTKPIICRLISVSINREATNIESPNAQKTTAIIFKYFRFLFSSIAFQLNLCEYDAFIGSKVYDLFLLIKIQNNFSSADKSKTTNFLN